MKKIGSSIVGIAGTIAILTLVSRVVGFVRVWAQNGALGSTQAGTAFASANQVPNILFEVVAGGALAGAVIPLISGFLAKGAKEELERTASALLTWVVCVGGGVGLIVAATAHPIMAVLLGASAPEAEVDFAATLLRIFAIQIPLYGASVVLTGILQAHKKFLLPALAPMLSSIVMLGAFAAFSYFAHGQQQSPELLPRIAVYVLGWGTTLGVVFFSLPQLIPVIRIVKIRPTFSFPPGVLGRVLKLAGAGLGGLLAQQVETVVVMMFANDRGGVGAYPVFTFANAVYMLPYAVLAVPIATAVFPRLSEVVALEGRPGLEDLVARSTRLVFEVALVCVVLLVVIAQPMAAIFGILRPVPAMEIAMIAMAPGLVGYSLIYHCSRVLYAIEASRQVLIANTVAWLSVAVALVVPFVLGISGRENVLIAIGVCISLGMSIGAFMEIVAIRNAVGKHSTRGMFRSGIIVGVLSIVAGFVAYWLVSVMNPVSFVTAFAALILGAFIVVGVGVLAIFFFDRSALRLTGKIA